MDCSSFSMGYYRTTYGQYRYNRNEQTSAIPPTVLHGTYHETVHTSV